MQPALVLKYNILCIHHQQLFSKGAIVALSPKMFF
jgi:hypothetical protein